MKTLLFSSTILLLTVIGQAGIINVDDDNPSDFNNIGSEFDG
jgi:hypothetical protein